MSLCSSFNLGRGRAGGVYYYKDVKINRYPSKHGQAQARCECIGRIAVDGCNLKKINKSRCIDYLKFASVKFARLIIEWFLCFCFVLFFTPAKWDMCYFNVERGCVLFIVCEPEAY